MNYMTVKYCDDLNGPGIRVSLWLAGCTHNCKGCHNPETHDPNAGQLYKKGICRRIIKEMESPFIEGLAITGGDPMHEANVDEVRLLCEIIKIMYPEKTIWVYTGYTIEELLKAKGTSHVADERIRILNSIDVLVDGRFVEELKDSELKWRGSSNQRLIDTKATLKKGTVVEAKQYY